MTMRSVNVRYSADPVDLGVQGDLIGAPELLSIEFALPAQSGGDVRGWPPASRLRSVTRVGPT